MDIEGFYEADERRRRSEEVELGTDWTNDKGSRFELSWVADTGELYIMGEPNVALSEDFFGDIYENRLPTSAVTVAVVGWIPDRGRVEQVFDGWQKAMAADNSLVWLVERLRQQDVPRQPPG